MKGVRDRQERGADAPLFQVLAQLLHCPGFARYCQAAWGVVGGNFHIAGQERTHHLLASQYCGHGPARRQGLHQLSTQRHQGDGFFQAEYPRDACSGVFADAMASHQIRYQAPRAPELGERVPNRKNHGLGVLGLGQHFLTRLRSVEQVYQRTIEMGAKESLAALQCLSEKGMTLVEPLSHAHVLSALSGEEKGNLAARRARRACPEARDLFATHVGLQSVAQLLALGSHHRQPAAEVVPPGMRRVAQVCQLHRLSAAQVIPVVARQFAHCFLTLRREAE